MHYSSLKGLTETALGMTHITLANEREDHWNDIDEAIKHGVGSQDHSNAAATGRRLQKVTARIKSAQNEILASQERLIALKEEQQALDAAMLKGCCIQAVE